MSILRGWQQPTPLPQPVDETWEHAFHRVCARELVRLHRLHKANDEHLEAQQCLELARLHTEHVLGCVRCSA